MSGNNINFDSKKSKYVNSIKNKEIFNIDGIDVDKILVCKKVSYSKNNSFKYFIRYNGNNIIRPLFVKPQTSSYINKFKDKKTKITTATMSLMVKDKQFFKNYNKIWGKSESLMRKKFNSKPIFGNDDNSKYIKTKIKTFKNSIITNFHNKKVPEEKIPYKCLSIIVLDSVIKTDNKYYPQTFLEECVYNQQKQQKQKQQKNYITEELESDSDSNNESESESESDSNSNDDETKSDIDNDE